MNRRAPLAVPALGALLAGCSGAEDRDAGGGERYAEPSTISASPAPAPSETPESSGEWDLVSSGEGAALVFPAAGAAAVRLFCPQDGERLLVNVPAFRPIGSEERLTFGSGGAAHALVADTRGDRQRGGVSGAGPVPGNLGALIGGPVSASYGAQTSGPHPAPPRALARAFLAACGSSPPPQPSGTPAANVSACLMQDGERLTNPRLRAIGTEPFWGAKIEGRCVTYSHPGNQQGTRVWTTYAARSGGGATWTGALEGRPFVLKTRPKPGCSDGMSDRRYPIAVELTVSGEMRRGCAEPR